MKKILVIRFSSIGDIVLTSPVLRCIKEQKEDCEIHFLTKNQYKSLVINNPNIDKVWTIQKSTKEIFDKLKSQDFDVIIDLHNNLRTLGLKLKLRKKSYSFPKLNIKKWFLVRFKIDKMPDIHIVERYFEPVKKIGVENDNKGIEYHFGKLDMNLLNGKIPTTKYITYAIGGQFATKKMPNEKIVELLKQTYGTIVLLGGKEDRKNATFIDEHIQNKVYNLCGELTIDESAWVAENSELLITHDTGMMHIASAFDIPIIAIWGNTIPKLGMYAYRPGKNETIKNYEVENLNCRPCSKIGHKSCPKGHFNCMNNQNTELIAQEIEQKMN